MDYKVIEDKDVFNVFETQTEQIIKTFDNRLEAKELSKHLNLGGGFDGFTPSFMLIKG